MLQGVEAGGGLALDGAGSGGLLRVGAIGVDLSWGCHDSDLACERQGVMRAEGGEVVEGERKNKKMSGHVKGFRSSGAQAIREFHFDAETETRRKTLRRY